MIRTKTKIQITRKGIEKKEIKTMNKNKSRNKKKQQERKKISPLHMCVRDQLHAFQPYTADQRIKNKKGKKDGNEQKKNIYKLRTKKNKQRSQKEPGTKYE